MTTMTQERPIFENEEWLVTESGLEHKTTGYFIERESLSQRRDDGLWTWPLHMAEKSWCAMMPFAEAFSCAASIYAVETDTGLAQTFKVAHCEIAPWPQVESVSILPSPARPKILRNKDGTPIYMKSGSSKKSLEQENFQSPGESWRMRNQTSARSFSTVTRIPTARLGLERENTPPWRSPRQMRKTGTKLVRLLQAAWSTR